MIEQSITVTDTEIVILAQFFIHKDYSVTNKDLILDVLAKHYTGQHIVIRLLDGENIKFSGFDHFVKYMCDHLHIPYDKITIESHCPDNHEIFKTQCLKMGIFISVTQYLPHIDKNLNQAKFVGSLLGRYNLTRFRLAYELDCAFPGDTFITFQPTADFVKERLKHTASLYQQELNWLEHKQFDRDITSRHYMGMVDWYDACRSYGNVWNRYQIEVISETDAVDNFWFTEKTANCLATGKPFVLVSGSGSLQRLQDMGFVTFGDILDESYDSAKTSYDRIQRLTRSLQDLYTSTSKAESLNKLYQQAAKNIELYQQYIWK